MANVVKPTTANINNSGQQASTDSLQRSYIQNTNSSTRLSQQAPYNGQTDSGGEYRLRIGIVDNPDIQRDSYVNVDPLDITNIYNNNTGQITLRWIDMPGGPIRPQSLGGEWTHNEDNEKYNPEEREYNDWNIQSRREMLSLTSPLIWSNDTNYCGMNYVPPVGSIAVVGFRKHGLPLILGYLPTHSKVCYPVLKPGEIVMKGYGNNYTQWRWSDKLDLKAWSVKGAIDQDDPNKQKTNDTNCTLWIRLDANNRCIKLSAYETDPPPQKQNQSQSTEITLMPGSLTIASTEIYDESSPSHSDLKNTKYYQDSNSIQMTVGSASGNGSSRYQDGNTIIDTVGSTVVTQTANEFNIKSPTFTINSQDINITSNGQSSINASNFAVQSTDTTINSSNIIMNGGSEVSVGTPSMIVNTSGDFSVKSGNVLFNSGSFKLNSNTTISGTTAINGNATYNGSTIVNTSTDRY